MVRPLVASEAHAHAPTPLARHSSTTDFLCLDSCSAPHACATREHGVERGGGGVRQGVELDRQRAVPGEHQRVQEAVGGAVGVHDKGVGFAQPTHHAHCVWLEVVALALQRREQRPAARRK
jgi:hypothetical protein